jgi:hypothetical protein
MENEDYQKSNREKNLSPKLGLFWCGHCDTDLINAGNKCSTCRNRNGKKRIKKDI